MMTEADKKKIGDFVNHLLSNPNIKNESTLVAEGMLLNFIVQNREQLKVTFKTPQFFPHLDWNESLSAIVSTIYNLVIGSVMPVLDGFIETFDTEALNKISKNTKFPESFHREKLKSFTQSIMQNKDARYNMNSVINIFKYNALERYLGEMFAGRDYLYNELVRVQKTYLECDEYITYLKVLLIVKNAAFVKIPLASESAEKKFNLNDSINSPAVLKKFLDSLLSNMKKQLPNLPEKTLKLAIKANMWEKQTELEDSSSRFLYIFSKRYHDYKPVDRVDRGAESPDRSWFGIARKNAEYYGFNKRMLDELYRISGDNNW
jgi:hypothetical protein